jgi:transposase
LTDGVLGIKPREIPMKTQIQKPAHGKVSYTEEYKQQALELWRKSGRSAAKVGAELGIRPALLYEWTKVLREENTALVQTARKARSLEELEAENRRLREENAKLLEQREVLKKSLGILSEPPPRGMPGSQR